ncbi:MAG: DUF5036 family protein [Tannerellaceae bacterium]|jgi:hypothetical protein|nr:DUF5036 family protein [Tannerellaceae bacterium]
MMNENNGMTELGNSDVYINNANNFYSQSCLLSSLGKKNELGNISDILLLGGTNTTAVEPGKAYQIFSKESIKKFPSGKLALNIAANYYNVYVVSQMKQENTITGAIVKFILMDVPKNDLPAFNDNIGTLLDYTNTNLSEITIELPTSDFEYEPTFNNVFNVFEHKKEGNKLIVRIIEYSLPQDIGFYIRIKDSYTYVTGRLH